jgi:TRIAD3 protein (E3 ubiquitin-protein ligase RNF216)
VNPKCGKKFCRLCHKGSHMPMPCDGATADKYAARRGIEEAMSDALIRTCNKCKSSLFGPEPCGTSKWLTGTM